MALRRVRTCVNACATILLAACSNRPSGPSLGPHNPNSNITFIAGNNQTDTIQTTLVQALVVHINAAPAGQSVSDQIIQFQSVLDSTGQNYQAYLETLTQAQQLTFVADTADASGNASAIVVLGTLAGRARIVVKVPAFGFVDTAFFTTKPGKAATLESSPGDTTVFSGSHVTFHSTVRDRAGNLRTDSVSYSVGSGPVTLSGATATMTNVGRASIVSSGAGLLDTALISAVPKGVLAASTGGGLVLFNTDGSGLQQFTLSSGVGTLKWAPNGETIVFDGAVGGCEGGNANIEQSTLSGAVWLVVATGGTAEFTNYSRDGTWIYYSFIGPGALYRVHPDGTGNDSLITQMPDFDIWPSSSPDGNSVAYVADHSSSSDLRVLTVATGAVTSLGVNAWSPEWSPTSNQIAYLATPPNCSGPIAIVNADGTSNRSLATSAYESSFDWSPDGQWIAAQNATTAQIDLINVNSGLTLPLAYTRGYSSPAWAPTSVTLSANVKASPKHQNLTKHMWRHG